MKFQKDNKLQVRKKDRWSLKFDACRGHSGTDRPHKAFGLCAICYQQWYREHPKKKKKVKMWENRRRKRHRRARNAYWRKKFGPRSSPERRTYEKNRKRLWYLRKKAEREGVHIDERRLRQ